MYVYMIMCMCKGSDCLQTAAGTLTAPGAALSIGAAIKDHWTQRSPTWHRRLRSRRSQARKCLQAGLPLSRRARQLLSFHHGTCPYHRRVILSSMGGKGPKPWTKEQDKKWNLWHGAYSQPWRQPHNPKAAMFPTYDGVDLTKEMRQLVPSGETRGQTSSYLTQDLQSAVNATRKAEVKVQRLHQAYATAQEQWIVYERKAKENFVREKKRFLSNLEKIEKDAMEAEEYQDECRQAVRAIVIGAGPATSGPSRPAKVEPDVETLFASWAEEEGDEGVMQRALGAAHAARLLNTPHRGRASVPMTPRASDKRSTGQTPARVDPYIATGEAANLATLTPNSVAAGGPMGPGGAPGLSPQVPKHPGQRSKDRFGSRPTRPRRG